MADANSRRQLKEIRSQSGNNLCCECGKLNPQWVSVTYAIWICIECSGKHRLLGLHISQVKSITMDKWLPKDVDRIRVGGNASFKEFLESHSDFNPEWTLEEKYNSLLVALYRDKITMEAAGEIWIEEESPVFLNKQAVSLEPAVSLTNVDLASPSEEKPPQLEEENVVEVAPDDENLDSFSRLGLGFGVASKFMKETAEMAKSELSEFKESNKNFTDTKQNISSTLSSWTCWASSLAKTSADTLGKVTDNLHAELTKNEAAKEDQGDEPIGNSFWSNFGQKRPPPMCMSVQTISEPEDNAE